jgi:hypothetical protein
VISNRHVIVTVIAAAAFVSVGCGGAITASLQHPARVGRVMPHALVKHDRNGEGTGFGARMLASTSGTSTRRLPPGALDDAIRLVRFDEAGVCFDLLSRHTEPDPIDYRNGLAAQLYTHPGGAAVTSLPVAIGSAPRAHTEVAEQDFEVQDGWSSGCDENGCWSAPTYGVETRGVEAAVYETRTLFCFANDGSLTPATGAIELSVAHSRFRWQFDAPADGWAQPVITMEPVYVAPTDQLLRMALPPAAAAAIADRSIAM